MWNYFSRVYSGGTGNIATGTTSNGIVVLGEGNTSNTNGHSVIIGADNTANVNANGAMIGFDNISGGTRQFVYGSNNDLGVGTSKSAFGNGNSMLLSNRGYAYGNNNTFANATNDVDGGVVVGINNTISALNTYAFGFALTASEPNSIYIGTSRS